MTAHFAVLSDPHVTLPHTLRDYRNRSHFLEVSVGAIETVLTRLAQEPLDFLLIPGDLTQDGETENHQWLAHRLRQLPFPSFVIAGNHDLRVLHSTQTQLGQKDFAQMYRASGYAQTEVPYFHQEVLPNLHIIGLNSTYFFPGDLQATYEVDAAQLHWLQEKLQQLQGQEILVMVHHNLLEHLPSQATQPATCSYMLQNYGVVQALLREYGVRWVFTGHFHMQDIAYRENLYDITTGSLVSYPHPYRLCTLADGKLTIHTQHLTALPAWPNLTQFSLAKTCALSDRYLLRLLTSPPLRLTTTEAEACFPYLRNFWAKLCAGDAHFDFPDLPEPVRMFFERYNDLPPGDNDVVLG